MKLLISPLMAGLAFLDAVSAAGTPANPPTDRALVTLPWAEARSLLAPPPPAEPPVAAAITQARIVLAFPATGVPAATAEFAVEVIAPGWRLVPLVDTSLALAAAAPAGTVLVPKDGMLCLLARGPGQARATLTFDLPDELTQPGSPGIHLRTAAAAVGRIEAGARPGARAVMTSGEVSRAGGTLALPADGGAVTVRWVEDRPPVPTPWKTEVETLIVPLADRLICQSRLRLSGDRGTGTGARLELPAAALCVQVEGLDLRSPRIQAGGADLAWETPGILSRDLLVRCELPLPLPRAPWPIQPPAIAGATGATARTLLVPFPGEALSGAGGRSIAEPALLPAWMLASLDGGAAFEVRQPGPFTVEARPLPSLKADTARIARARYRSRIVSDGARLCEATIAFRRRGPLRWRFSLPKGSELLTCEVGGRATNPLLLEDGGLALVLAGPPGEDDAKSSEVTFSYTERGPGFAPVEGKLALALPATPLFIEELDWAISLPPAYEATAFEGNVEPGAADDAGITFHKRLVRNEAATLEIYYQKRAASR